MVHSVSTSLKRATSPKQVILPKECPFEVLSGYTFGWNTCLQLDMHSIMYGCVHVWASMTL